MITATMLQMLMLLGIRDLVMKLVVTIAWEDLRKCSSRAAEYPKTAVLPSVLAGAAKESVCTRCSLPSHCEVRSRNWRVFRQPGDIGQGFLSF